MSRDGFGGAPSAAPTFPEPAEAAVAFHEVLPELRALAAEQIRPVNFDVPRVVAIAMGAAPRIAALRAEILDEAPRTPVASLDGLRRYALAAYYAHLLALPAPTSEPAKKALLDEASPLRKNLLLAAEALAAKGLVDGALVAKIRSGTGRLDTAGDLIALASLFTSAWPRVEDKTAVTTDDVERAGALGAHLLVALSHDPLPAVDEETPGELRARAFTLLVWHYDECRRAIAYVRYRKGDADAIAPSLFARGPRRKKKAAEAP